MQLCGIGASIDHFHTDQHIVGSGFGILNNHIEITIVIENASVDELELQCIFSPLTVFCHELVVGKLGLGILVQKLHVRMARRRIEIEIILLDVLAVIPFVSRQSEETLLENGVFAVPEGKRKTYVLMSVGNPAEPVFSPAIRTAPCLIVR